MVRVTLVDELCSSVPSVFVYRQLYAQEAACRLQAVDLDGKSLQRLSKEEYLKMMLPDSPPGEDRNRKVRSMWLIDWLINYTRLVMVCVQRQIKPLVKTDANITWHFKVVLQNLRLFVLMLTTRKSAYRDRTRTDNPPAVKQVKAGQTSAAYQLALLLQSTTAPLSGHKNLSVPTDWHSVWLI